MFNNLIKGVAIVVLLTVALWRSAPVSTQLLHLMIAATATVAAFRVARQDRYPWAATGMIAAILSLPFVAETLPAVVSTCLDLACLTWVSVSIAALHAGSRERVPSIFEAARKVDLN